jgi:hypothetical protein
LVQVAAELGLIDADAQILRAIAMHGNNSTLQSVLRFGDYSLNRPAKVGDCLLGESRESL